MSYLDYVNTAAFPTTWCGGCGNGLILKALAMAMDETGASKENTVVVTGIGCWGKADDYLLTNAFHGSHGRALAFATGIKLAQPELNVIVLIGDGDGVTIGGNHFIHAARRGLDVTVIMSNNLNYGMTGGQYSGTTPEHSITATSPYGLPENGFNVSNLAITAGAAFAARESVENVNRLKKHIIEGMSHKGFSFIEAISTCPTYYGRNNGNPTAKAQMDWIKENSITPKQAEGMTREELKGKFVMGKLHEAETGDYSTRYKAVIEKAQAERSGK